MGLIVRHRPASSTTRQPAAAASPVDLSSVPTIGCVQPVLTTAGQIKFALYHVIEKISTSVYAKLGQAANCL
jgi:hypothetical protein